MKLKTLVIYISLFITALSPIFSQSESDKIKKEEINKGQLAIRAKPVEEKKNETKQETKSVNNDGVKSSNGIFFILL